MEITARTLDDTQGFADQAVRVLREASRISERSVVLGLFGDLGAGKTTFVQCIAQVLGVADVVTSSSFVLRSDYITTDAVFKQLIHIDAYRLENTDEIYTIGWDAVLAERDALVIVEWADNIADRLPADARAITITVCGDERVFTTDFLVG